MASLGKLIVELSANTTKFQTDLGKAATIADKRMRSIEMSAKRVDRAIGTLGRGIAGLAGAFSGGALVRSITEVATQAQNLSQISQNLDFPTDKLQQFFIAADQANVSTQQLTTAFQRMQRRISQAADGTGEAAAALQELGLDAIELEQLGIDQQFELINAELAKLAAPDRTRLLQKIFDSEGVRAVQDTVRAVEQLGDKFDDLVLTDEQLADLNEFRGILDDISTSAKGAQQQLGAFFASIVVGLRDANRAVEENLSPNSRLSDLLIGRQLRQSQQLGIDPLGPPRRGGRRRRPTTITISGGIPAAAGAVAAAPAIQDFAARPRPVSFGGVGAFDLEKRAAEQRRKDADALTKKIREQERASQQAADAARELGLTFTSAFEDAVLGGQKLGDVLKALASDIARVFLRRAVTEPLLGQFSASVGGLLTPRAMGGPVAAGSPYLVGERGPELMVPSTAGAIVPNNELGGNTVNLTVNALDSSSIYNYRQEIVAIIRDGFARRGNRVDLG